MVVNIDLDTFDYGGVVYRRIWAKGVDKFFVGVDLGQSMDHTAVAVIRHQVVPLETFTPNADAGTLRQDRTETYDCVHLERYPLGLEYPLQVDRVGKLLSRDPLRGNAELVIDQTGPGAAVGDLFQQRGLKPLRIVITGGFEAVRHGQRKFAVPKHEIVSNLDAKLHTGQLRFAADLLEAEHMKDELKNFHRNVTASGRSTFEARGTAHDDAVLAVGLALWRATGGGGRGETRVGTAIGCI